jgi:hypothetical protein
VLFDVNMKDAFISTRIYFSGEWSLLLDKMSKYQFGIIKKSISWWSTDILFGKYMVNISIDATYPNFYVLSILILYFHLHSVFRMVTFQ